MYAIIKRKETEYNTPQKLKFKVDNSFEVGNQI